jgi:hypothetical protein
MTVVLYKQIRVLLAIQGGFDVIGFDGCLLDHNPANYEPPTPLTFLERLSSVTPEHTAIASGRLRRSYASFYTGAGELGSVIQHVGMRRGDSDRMS